MASPQKDGSSLCGAQELGLGALSHMTSQALVLSRHEVCGMPPCPKPGHSGLTGLEHEAGSEGTWLMFKAQRGLPSHSCPVDVVRQTLCQIHNLSLQGQLPWP